MPPAPPPPCCRRCGRSSTTGCCCCRSGRAAELRVTAFPEPSAVSSVRTSESEPMAESPLSESPYEVLGVSADADAAALRLAYRRALRTAHPDTGGDATRFHAVQ